MQPAITEPETHEFYNKCHNPEGAAGGQFCSDSVEYVNGTTVEKKALRLTMSAIDRVHDIPDKFPKVYVELSDELGEHVDGYYESENDRIVLNVEKSQKEITLVHEFGHHLSLGEEGNFSRNQFLDKVDRITTLKAVFNAIEATSTSQGIRDIAEGESSNAGFFSYLNDERESFARAYAQWVANESGDKTLKSQHKELTNYNPNMGWPDKEFTPITDALKKHFKARSNTTFALEPDLITLHEFYNKCHDAKTGQFCEVHGTHHNKIEIASHDEKIEAKRLVRHKIKYAPAPTGEDVTSKARQLQESKEKGGRSGGDFRFNSKGRDVLQQKLWEEFDGPEKGYVVDAATGIKMHYSDDPALNPNRYPKFTLGRIFTTQQGGGYSIRNIIPELLQSNQRRGSRPVRPENT